MLNRREILQLLKEIGITRMNDIKQTCRIYENYFRDPFGGRFSPKETDLMALQ